MGSQPQKYGDERFDAEAIENFEAYQDRTSLPFKYYKEWVPSKQAVSSRDVKLAVLQHRYLAAIGSDDEFFAAAMVEVDFVVFEMINDLAAVTDEFMDDLEFGHVHVTNYDCLKFAYSAYEAHCDRFDDYSLKYVNSLVN